ncbi:MAG: AAA family ATPase [Candidatus Sungiibacteriota bacterium]
MMTFSFSKNRFAGVSRLENVLPRQSRAYLGYAALGAILASLFISSVRLFALALALRLLLLMLDAYARSQTYIREGDGTDEDIARRFNYYASSIWRAASSNRTSITKIARGFIRAPVGCAILARLGIDIKTYRDALAPAPTLAQGRAAASDTADTIDPITLLTQSYETRSHRKEIGCGDLLLFLFTNCVPVKNLFLASELTEDDLRGAAIWVERLLTKQDRIKRWWTREQLAAIPGIGKQWAYGRTYYLAQFGRELIGDASIADRIVGRETELRLLEISLLKQSGANALLIGDPGAGKKTILSALADRIRQGIASPMLEDKHIIMLDGAAITASAKTKSDTEALLINIFNEAAAAGNIILAIEAFPEFVASLASLGISVRHILAPYLASHALHCVALADTAPFRRIIASDAGLLAHFGIIYLGDIDRTRLITIMEDHAAMLEDAYRGKVLITYPALRAAADAALDHLTEGALPKRAIDILEEIVGSVIAAGERIVLPKHISRIVSEKMRIPMGVITPDERAALQNLESALHARVIGQDTAIAAIADTIRRSRTGIRNPKRPIGSFLFLGPTGVGKTESAKALAAVYFNDEERMIRFDMSEYQTEQDIAKLLGSAERNDPGLLAAAVRHTPYSVILLDEFEKSRIEIRNIFLAILDEGFFTNALGERIILRNMIIIATSNAGALLIQDMIRQNKDPVAQKNALIEHIEKEAHLSPELLNRFDSLVIFSPLDPPTLRAIAALMLDKLARRLKKQNYMLEITPELIDAVAAGGFDPQFGARPMQRWIQDHIEKSITDRILAGSIAPGIAFKINAGDNSVLPK